MTDDSTHTGADQRPSMLEGSGTPGDCHHIANQTVGEISAETAGTDPVLDVGVHVYVRNRFLGDWTSGFKVAEVLDRGYRLRRLSDGHSFPDVFPFEDVRRERRHEPSRETSGSTLDRRHH